MDDGKTLLPIAAAPSLRLARTRQPGAARQRGGGAPWAPRKSTLHCSCIQDSEMMHTGKNSEQAGVQAVRDCVSAPFTIQAASSGVGDLGTISSPLREVEIATRSPTPRDAPAGCSHVYQRAKHAKGLSARNRPERPIQARTQRPAARTVTNPPKGIAKADFGRLLDLTRCHEAVSGKHSGLTGCSTHP